MTKKGLNITLALFLVVLVAVFGIIRMKDSQKMNYYQLNEKLYLHKLDYFSSYSISARNNSDYQDIITKVKDIAINKDSIVVRYFKGDKIQYAILRNDSEFYTQINNSNLKQFNSSNFDFVNPWKIVEQKTLNDSNKLISQILIITIIVLGFYLIMRVFNIKKLTL